MTAICGIKMSMVQELSECIHDTFVSVIKNDFVEAKKEILIASPYIQKKQINRVLEWLKIPLQTKIPVTIITCPIKSYKEQEQVRKCIEILQLKLTVIQKPDTYQKFIIIDNQLVWYRGISLFDFWNQDDTIIRLESRVLVAEPETYFV